MKPYTYYIKHFESGSTGLKKKFYLVRLSNQKIRKPGPGIMGHQSLSREDREDRQK
tara:strand:+ start:175 stop:342 length:168 start_codon:yes stop_codon:yes gene_type:complete